MYKIYNKSDAVKQVQKYLAKAGNSEFFIAPTGIFDSNTRSAVKEFQSQEGLKDTSVVDKTTFDLLYQKSALEQIKYDVSKATKTFIGFPIYYGDRADGMERINHMIETVLRHHGKDHRVTKTAYFTKETLSGVNILREIFMLEGEGSIDEIFYYRLVNEYTSIHDLNNFFI